MVLVPQTDVWPEALGWDQSVQEAGSPRPEEYKFVSALIEASTSIQDRVQSSYLQAPVLDTSHQATNKTGMQKYSSVDRLSKLILSSQTCQYTPADTALLIRRKKLSSSHRKKNTSPSSQEAYTSHWTNLTHQGQRPESRGTTVLQSVEMRPQTQLNKMRRQKNMYQMEDQVKNPHGQINEEGKAIYLKNNSE